MAHLSDYLSENEETQAAFAARVGISKSYMSEIMSGAKRPGLTLAFRIETATGGRVPAAVWAGDVAAPEGKVA